MIPHLRSEFNKKFTESSYRRLLERLDQVCGMHVEFRVSETPLFLPASLVSEMKRAGKEIVAQLMASGEYLLAAEKTIPSDYRVPHEDPRPRLLAVDFGIVQTADGSHVPRLIELQGFPSLFCFQLALNQVYREVYGLSDDLDFVLSGLSVDRYEDILRGAILGSHLPEHVILLELDPERQKTRPDFLLTERLCGIATVNVRDVVRDGRQLFYDRMGKRTAIHRIYNRVIVDELQTSGVKLPFRFHDDLDVEWVVHPNWFFKLSKFSIPYIDHPTVPRTIFLDKLDRLPDQPEQWVLKPLYSFAGSGVIVGPTRKDIESISENLRGNYILQERVEYAPVVETPFGGTKAEVRILYIWQDELLPVLSLVRMGRGKMMGVSFNKDMRWVGSSAGFFPRSQ